MKFIKKINYYRTVIIVLITLLSIIRLTKEDELYPTGDAVEYTIMTEAFLNHFSPDVRSEDFETFKKAYCKVNPWQSNPKWKYYDEVQKYISSPHKLLEYDYAFFTDKNGKQYSCHFFFYSLINIPSKVLCNIFEFNPLFIHQLTNLLLLISTCILLFKYSNYDDFYTSVLVLLFFFSTNYWYLSWQHPEIFTVCASSLGIWVFLNNKYYLGLFLISLAALQNQPIAVIILALTIYQLFNGGLNIKNMIRTGLSTFIVIIPSAFYYLHFGVTNLIKYQGALSFDYVNSNRVLGLFFDINQGAILAIPLIILLYIILLIISIKPALKEPKKYAIHYILPLSIIGAVCIAATIDNWNHGQTVVNRYVTYFSGIIIIHFFYLVMQLKSRMITKYMLYTSIITQIGTVYYHSSITKYDWDTNTPKPISNWVLDNFPKLYNPDNVIFTSRYLPEKYGKLNETPLYYMKEDASLTKLLVHKKHIKNLDKLGLTERQIDSIDSQLNYRSNWAYINVDYNFLALTNPLKLKQFVLKILIEKKIKEIKHTPEWYASIKTQAKEEGLTEDEALIKNAAYVLNIEPNLLDENGLSIEKLIENKIQEIKKTPEWINAIELKSKEKNIELDSALYMDAKWIIEQEFKNKP
jgi:hypothetical protein